jgi:hypothetical protein
VSTDDHDLDPRFIEALRAVPPADTQTREQHLAFAMSEIREPGRSRRSRQWLAAAAALVLVGVGGLLGRVSGSTSNTTVAEGSASSLLSTETTFVPKGGAGSTSTRNTPVDSSRSACESPGLTFVALLDSPKGRLLLYVTRAPAVTLIVVIESTCTVLREIDLP